MCNVDALLKVSQVRYLIFFSCAGQSSEDILKTCIPYEINEKTGVILLQLRIGDELRLWIMSERLPYEHFQTNENTHVTNKQNHDK